MIVTAGMWVWMLKDNKPVKFHAKITLSDKAVYAESIPGSNMDKVSKLKLPEKLPTDRDRLQALLTDIQHVKGQIDAHPDKTYVSSITLLDDKKNTVLGELNKLASAKEATTMQPSMQGDGVPLTNEGIVNQTGRVDQKEIPYTFPASNAPSGANTSANTTPTHATTMVMREQIPQQIPNTKYQTPSQTLTHEERKNFEKYYAYWREIDFYLILGLTFTNDKKEILQGFLNKVKRFHPDNEKYKSNQYTEIDENEFKATCYAFQVLNDSKAKLFYDELRQQAHWGGGGWVSSNANTLTSSSIPSVEESYRVYSSILPSMEESLKIYEKFMDASV